MPRTAVGKKPLEGEAMSIELLRIVDAPSGPPPVTAFGGMLVLQAKSPRGSTFVTVRLDWGAEEVAASCANSSHESRSECSAREPAAESKELYFDLLSLPAHSVERPNQSYKITLMQIGSDKGLPWYEFQITTQ